MKKILSIILLLIACGCEYTPSEVEDAGVQPVVDPPIDIFLHPGDSILYISWQTAFSFDSLVRDKPEITFDNNMIVYSIADDKAYFTIDPTGYSDGEHELKIEVKVHPGNGSIADKMGMEKVKKVFRWKVIINKSLSKIPVLHSVVEENGTCKITWNRYNVSSFKSYSLYKTENGRDNYSININNIDDTVFYDRNVTFGNYRYYLVILYQYPNGVSPKSNEISIDSPIEMTKEFISSSKIKLKWQKPLFYNNIESYSIVKSNDTNCTLFSGNDKNATECVFESDFPYIDMLTFRAKGKDPEFGKKYYQVTISTIKDTFPDFVDNKLIHCYSPDNIIYYLNEMSSNYYYNIYSLDKKSVLLNRNNYYQHFFVSENNHYPIIQDCNIVYIFKPPYYGIWDTIRIQKLPSGFIKYTDYYDGSISNDGKLLLLYTFSEKEKSYILRYNLNDKSLVSLDSTDMSTSIESSASGNYAFIYLYKEKKISILKYQDSKLSVVKKISVNDYKYKSKFIPGTDKIAIMDGNQMQIWDCESGTMTYSFETESTSLLDIDYTNNYALTKSADYVHIYDLANGALKKRFRYSDDNLILMNSTLIGKGFITKVVY